MAGREERDNRADIVSAMFALLTARLEDAAGMAGNSQARLADKNLRANIATIEGIIAEAGTVAKAIAALLRRSSAADRDVDDK
jgi:hypothetical protein